MTCSKHILVFVCVAIMAPAIVHSQRLESQGTNATLSNKRNTADALVVKQLTHQYAWLHDTSWRTEAWTGDERPYKSIRASVDAALAAKINPDVLLTKYKAAAVRSPADPKNLFRWAYTAYMAATQAGNPDKMGTMQVLEAREAFPFAHSPHTYEYDRLRFLIQSSDFGPVDMVPVGARLLKSHPNDYDVNYNYVKCLSNDPKQTSRLKALAGARKLVQQHPNLPSVYALLASSCWTLWAANNDKSYAMKAVAAYQQYLQKAPANYAYRTQAASNIAYIQAKMAQ